MMLDKNYKYEYCMKCGKETDQDSEVCVCGSKNFIFGDNFTYEDSKVVCGCGNDQFKMVAHFNMSPVFNKTYKCSKCRSHVGMQTYLEDVYC